MSGFYDPSRPAASPHPPVTSLPGIGAPARPSRHQSMRQRWLRLSAIAAELRFLELAFSTRLHPDPLDHELVVHEIRRIRRKLAGGLVTSPRASR